MCPCATTCQEKRSTSCGSQFSPSRGPEDNSGYRSWWQMPSPTKLWGIVSPVLVKEFWEILDNILATFLSVLTTSFILVFWKFSELWKGHWKGSVRDNHIIVISHEESVSAEENFIYYKYTVITLSFELTFHLQHLWREQVLTHMPTSDSWCEHLTGPEYHGPDWKRHIIAT